MATQRVSGDKPAPKRRRRATTPEARQNQLIAMAFDAAEQMLLSPNPPAQIVTHFAKMGSMRERVELEYKEEEMRLLKMKTEALASQKRVEELYVEAMDAFRTYSGSAKPVTDDDEFDDDYS